MSRLACPACSHPSMQHTLLVASPHATQRPLLLLSPLPMTPSRRGVKVRPSGRPGPPAVAGRRLPRRAERRSSDFLSTMAAVAGGMWMTLIFRTHVWSLASGLGQATRFDSSVGVPVLYHFSGALDVRSGRGEAGAFPTEPRHHRCAVAGGICRDGQHNSSVAGQQLHLVSPAYGVPRACCAQAARP